MSWGEDEREEKFYRYCYSCGDRWKSSNTDRNFNTIKIPGGTSDELPRGFKKGNWIICDWCDVVFKKSELLQLIKTKSKREIREIKIEKIKEYWKKKKRRKWKI